MPHEKSAGVIIFRKENGNIYYLLLRHASVGPRSLKKGHWDFPKGHIEQGEKSREAAIREVEEETGIKDLKMVSGFRSWIKYFFRKNYELKKEDKNKAPLIFKTVDFYLAQTNTKQIRLSHEHIGYKWLDYQGTLRQVNHKNAKNILNQAHNFLIKKKIY